MHSGKHIDVKPEVKPEPTKEEKIELLKTKLDQAVQAQEFEQAAKLRDEIKALENG